MQESVSLLLKYVRKAVFCPINTITSLSHQGTLATVTVEESTES